MSLPKRKPDISPSITLAEVSKLMEEQSTELAIQIGNKVLHLRQSDVRDDDTRSADPEAHARIVAEKALIDLRKNNEWIEHIDETTGMTVLRHRNWTGKFDPERFIAAAAELEPLIDWDELVETIELTRLADIERDHELWGPPGE